MNHSRIILIVLMGIFTMGTLSAQEPLTLDKAIRSALENNYGIRVAEYDIQSAESDVFRGNAGLLPTLALTGNAVYNSNALRGDLINLQTNEIQEFSADTVRTPNAALSLGVDWVVFNGFANTRRFEILGATANLTKEQNINLVESSIVQVANAYYSLAKLVQSYEIQVKSLERSRERLAFVENQAEFGTVNSLAVLNARVDVNTDSINVVTTLLNLDNARRDLNYLIGSPLDAGTEIDLSVDLTNIPDLSTLEGQVRENNSSIRTAEQSRRLSELNLKLAQAGYYPTLSLNASYGLNYNENPFSIVPRIFSFGYSGGVSLNVPIYNGSQVSRSIQKAEIGVAQSTAQITQTQQQVLRDLRNAYFTYQNNREILRLQQLSLKAAEENFTRTKERFELGQSTSVAFRDAQINLLLAENRLNDLLYDVKISEVNLMQVSGNLLPQE